MSGVTRAGAPPTFAEGEELAHPLSSPPHAVEFPKLPQRTHQLHVALVVIGRLRHLRTERHRGADGVNVNLPKLPGRLQPLQDCNMSANVRIK